DLRRQRPAPGVGHRRGRADHRGGATGTLPGPVGRAGGPVCAGDMTRGGARGRRMAHGNTSPPEKIDAALTTYFRAGNLTALRELALLWLADKVDEGLQRYRAEHGITSTWEA